MTSPTTGSSVSFRDHVLGPEEAVLWSRRGRWSVRMHRRTVSVVAVLAVLLVAAVLTSLLVGDFRVTPSALIDTLRGSPPNRMTEFFVMQRRLPRALVAAAVGAALAVAGAVFQMLTRNPLASPDVLGVSSGASAGAVVVLLVIGGTLQQAALGAAVGAVIAAAIIMVLNARTGLRGMGLILTGVGLAAVATAVVDYVISQVFIASATTAQTWIIGSLQGRGWDDLGPVCIALAVATPILVAASPSIGLAALGEASSTALGVRTGRLRWTMLAVATGLVAVAVATAGPVAFVALVAPHAARMLTRNSSLVAAGLVGALLLVAADLIAQYAFSAPVPVGAVTVSLGGIFFLWLLIREGRRSA